MKKLHKTLLAGVLMTCAAGAFATTFHGDAKPGHEPEGEPQHGMQHPPMTPPVFSESLQTTDAKGALDGISKNVPALETGKKYDVRVEVREVPPQPPLPPKGEAPKDAPKDAPAAQQ